MLLGWSILGEGDGQLVVFIRVSVRIGGASIRRRGLVSHIRRGEVPVVHFGELDTVFVAVRVQTFENVLASLVGLGGCQLFAVLVSQNDRLTGEMRVLTFILDAVLVRVIPI